MGAKNKDALKQFKINIRVSEDYFLKAMILLHSFPPFSKLNKKQLILLSILYEYNEKYKTIPLVDRNKLIFSYETRREIAERLGFNVNRIYMLTKGLRDNGIITKEGLLPQYIIPKSDQFIFNFIQDED